MSLASEGAALWSIGIFRFGCDEAKALPRYVVVMDVRWASVGVGDDDGYFLVLEFPLSLRGSVDFCSLGGTPSPSVRGFEGKAPQVGLWTWNPSMRFCTHRNLGQNH